MKKLLLSALLVLMACTMVACGTDEKEEMTVCTFGDSSTLLQENRIYHKGDTITKIEYHTSMNMDFAGVPEEDLKELIADVNEEFQGIEGLDYEAKIEDGFVNETVTVTFKGNVKELQELGFITTDDGSQAAYVSKEKTVTDLEAEGYTCK